MAECANCGHDNPPDEIFCRKCGHKIAWVAPEPELTPEEIQTLRKSIRALQEDLLKREEEIRKLDERLKEVTVERDELAKNPEVGTILRQLDEKDRALQDAFQELESLRKHLPDPRSIAPATKSHFVIESHPIPNPDFGITFDDDEKSLDLSTTGFRIRASLERNSDGSVGLLIHHGATINVKTPAETRWRRLKGEARLSTEVGMILFDPKGVMNARLDHSS